MEVKDCKFKVEVQFSKNRHYPEYGKNAYMLYNLFPVAHTIDNVIREQTDILEIAETLLIVANEKKQNSIELNEKINRNYSWVKKLEWSNICKNWINYFKETF
jgi:glycosyltransferase involved in cell wall biosynthesis